MMTQARLNLTQPNATPNLLRNKGHIQAISSRAPEVTYTATTAPKRRQD
jgi:hypothetical protein